MAQNVALVEGSTLHVPEGPAGCVCDVYNESLVAAAGSPACAGCISTWLDNACCQVGGARAWRLMLQAQHF